MPPPRPCEIKPPSLPEPPPPPPKPKVAAPSQPKPDPKPEPIETPADPPRYWFIESLRAAGSWKKNVPPQPVTGNAVEAYVEILDYYIALGKEIRATRANLADFIYLAGWGVDLDAFVDPPSANPRETLGTILERAAKDNVEIRVVLPDQPQEGQAGALARIAKLGGGGILDPFHKLVGTHHQKFVVIRNAGGVVAFCGGCDVDNARLGRDGVPAGTTAASGPQKSAPWHDAQVKVRGPAVADLWNAFVQRYSEVSAAYVVGLPLTKNPVTGMTAYGKFNLRDLDPGAPDPKTDGLDVQVARTYPNKNKKHLGDELIVYPRQTGYTFAPSGEMGIYRMLVHALELTKYTIYLEDQYLVNTAAMASNPPITSALKQVLDKPSFQKMIIAVAGTGTVRDELYQAGSRRAEFIQQLGPSAASKVETYVYGGDLNAPYWFHAKLWIFDDEFAVVGSANCNRRGYSYDSELCIGIADPRQLTGGMYFAKRLRMNLWLKHLNGMPQAAGAGAKGPYKDNDVRNFVAASALWRKAPLLQKVDFTSNPEADIPAKQKIPAKYPNAAKAYGAISNRDVDWSFIDPNGA